MHKNGRGSRVCIAKRTKGKKAVLGLDRVPGVLPVCPPGLPSKVYCIGAGPVPSEGNFVFRSCRQPTFEEAPMKMPV